MYEELNRLGLKRYFNLL